MGIKEVITAARSPWQNPFVERLIGSIRRDCLDHAIVLNESHLNRMFEHLPEIPIPAIMSSSCLTYHDLLRGLFVQ